MARRLLAPPAVRLAGPADAGTIRAFHCGHSPWYVRDAAKVVCRSASVLGTPAAVAHRTRVLLFGAESTVMAVAVVQQATKARTADLVVIAVHRDFQGA